MYCKNCGSEFSSDMAVVCLKCGVEKGAGHNFCPNCGEPVNAEAVVCIKCGSSLKPELNPTGKSKMAAGLMGLFLGSFGVHNFYLGYNTKGIIQLCLGVLGITLSCLGVGFFVLIPLGVWVLIESILILCGEIKKDGYGNPLI